MPERKSQARKIPSQKFLPLKGIGSTRRNLRGIYKIFNTPELRAKAMQKLLVRANLGEEPRSRVLSLIERARVREIQRVFRKKKEFNKKFSFPDNAVGKRFKEIDEMFWEAFYLRKGKDPFEILFSARSFAKKNDCREYAAEFFERIARKVKSVFTGTVGKREKKLAKALFREAVGHALILFKGMKNEKELQRLAAFARQQESFFKI